MLCTKARGTSGVHPLSVRIRMLLMAILLVLSLVCTIVAGRATVNAFQSFQQENTLMKQGDVRTIRPWMTIPSISRVYQVPESYLCDALHLSNTPALRHATLQMLAIREHYPVDKVIRTIQKAIVTYRRQHRTHSGMLIAFMSRAVNSGEE